MMYTPQDDAKAMTAGLFLRRRRCLSLLIASTLLAIPVLFVLRGPAGFDLKTKQLWSWASSHQFPSSAWPNQSASVDDVLFPPDNPAYILFEPPSMAAQMIPASSSSSASVVRPVRSLSAACLDAHFETGEPCIPASLPDPMLDVLWTWVNGSDRLLMESMAQAVRRNDPKMPATTRPNTELFRDHNELVHSVRSVLKYFKSSTTQLHIFTSDFPFNLPLADGDSLVNTPRRLGLAPSWLDLRDPPVWQHGDIKLSMVYHSQAFKNYEGIFNSYAIESQIKNLQGLSDNFVYMNDDFYMLADLTKSDFYTSTYGTVIRLQADLQVSSDPNPKVPPGGEWGPLSYTNWCLSNRFGTRSRPYITHTAKSLSLPLLAEFQSIWRAQLATTAAHPFRGMSAGGNRDVYAVFLFTHSLVERWREALLWSWAVGRVGGVDGEWGVGEREGAWASVGGAGEGGERADVVVKATYRRTAEPEEVKRNLEAAGHSMSGKTQYIFASGDGYPYGFTRARPRRVSIFPKFTTSPRPDGSDAQAGETLCQLSYSKCFAPQGKSITTANEFFKYVAFEQVECGDCIINALRTKSGSSGLSAFLPPRDKIYKPAWTEDDDAEDAEEEDNDDDDNTLSDTTVEAIAKMDLDTPNLDTDTNRRSTSRSSSTFFPPPHLPLVSHYQEGDFSLSEVLPKRGKTDIREWTLRLLQRYRFVLGDTPTRFHMVTSLNDARNQMRQVERDANAALLCVNDNIKGGSATQAQADVFLRDWQDRRWSEKADWEKR